MKFLPLLWRNLWRRKVRTIFTFLSIVVAFLLFGVLMAIRNSFEAGIEFGGDEGGSERLVIANRYDVTWPALIREVGLKRVIQIVQ